MAEYFDLRDGDCRPVGRTHPRGVPLPEGFYSLIVQVWIRNREGRFLISQRHPDKKYPLVWEATCGCVIAGESGMEAAVREVREELGVALDPREGMLLELYRGENVFIERWMFEWNGGVDALALQDTEVIDAKWASFEEILALHDRGVFGPKLADVMRLFGFTRRVPVAICPMRIDDYEGAVALWNTLPGVGLNEYDDSPEGIERYLKRNPRTCFVAKAGGEVVGTILSGHDGRRAMMYHLAVAESQRGRGIGTALVESAKKALGEEGILKVALLVFKENEAGNAFWEAQKFAIKADTNYRNFQLL